MRYKIDFDRTINQLVPYYMGGRNLILLLQSWMKPLRYVNDEFINWAKETRIEASMTSQIFPFEWFLNRKFQTYFEDLSQRIVISNGSVVGTPIYYEKSAEVEDEQQLKLSMQDIDDFNGPVLYYRDEDTQESEYSFIVNCPKLWKSESTGLLRNGLTENEFVSMLRYYIEKYRLSGKTYKIIIAQ